MKQDKTRKIDWFKVAIYSIVGMLIGMLISRIWRHEIMDSINNAIWITCWFVWFRIYKMAESRRMENEGLKSIATSLLTELGERSEKQASRDFPHPVWRICKAGHKFDSDAIVVGLGEDKDPRLVRCAVNDSKYILVSDLLKYLSTYESGDGKA